MTKDLLRLPHVRSILLCLGLSLTSVSNAVAECEQKAISTLFSPDNSWIAVVQENTCANEGFGMTNVTDIVELVRPGAQSRDNDPIFSIDRGSWQDRPQLRWLAADKLQIAVPNKSLISLQKNRYEGVDIEIKFVPDDPSERARWLKSLGLSTK